MPRIAHNALFDALVWFVMMRGQQWLGPQAEAAMLPYINCLSNWPTLLGADLRDEVDVRRGKRHW